MRSLLPIAKDVILVRFDSEAGMGPFNPFEPKELQHNKTIHKRRDAKSICSSKCCAQQTVKEKAYMRFSCVHLLSFMRLSGSNLLPPTPKFLTVI